MPNICTNCTLINIPILDRFPHGLWADFGSRFAISENNVRMDRPLNDGHIANDPLTVRKSAHKPPLHARIQQYE